ncbi:MAG: nucleotide exchange factor GrpE [Pseudomonadales bacterium]
MAEDKATSEDSAAEAVQDETLQQDESVEEQAEAQAAPDLAAELETALAQASANKEAELRAHAEMQNIRRRAERDVENAHKFALDKMAGELLAVVDNLERALQAAGAADESSKGLRDGVEMTLSSFVATLAKFNIEQIDPEGEPFNPQQHQAMSMIENADVEPNTVVAVLQKGYSLNGRLVRPAMVMVSKAAAAPKIDEQA